MVYVFFMDLSTANICNTQSINLSETHHHVLSTNVTKLNEIAFIAKCEILIAQDFQFNSIYSFIVNLIQADLT